MKNRMMGFEKSKEPEYFTRGITCQQAEQIMIPSDCILKMLLENTGNIVIICDLTGKLKYLNTASLDFGFSCSDLSGKNISDLYSPSMTRQFMKGVRYIAAGGDSFSNETYVVLQGKKHWFYNQMGPVRNTLGQIVAVSAFGVNITSRKEAEKHMANLTYHDKVTRLFNRTYLEDYLKKLEKNRQVPFSIIIGDINGLKFINDTFGHKAGDKLLRKAARLLIETCRKGDIVARSGGDEFAILMPNSDIKCAEEVCRNIKRKFSQTDSIPMQLSIALGYAEKDSPSKSTQEIFKEADARMYRNKLLEQKSSYGSLIASLQNTLYEKSQETEEHAQRIKTLALKMGKALNLPPYELDNLDLLATLHDIGKIAIPEELLFKAGPLSATEFKVLQTHSEIGYRIARTNLHLAQVAEGILAHHERWDGTGYPHGLKAGKIPLISRIIAIADSYDAMTHDRVYRKGIDPSEAINEIKRYSGTQFDPELVKAFERLFLEDFYQI